MTAGAFDHIREAFRAKVAGDYLEHLTPDGRWDDHHFDPSNDYQRHLYALFLKQAGIPMVQVWARIYGLSGEVVEHKRQRYTDEVIHSEIVGFPRKNGSLVLMPPQPVPEAPA